MYVELHCHSAFSFLDGASLPDELVPTALELGYQALALIDHNTVSGSMEFAVAARALGLRPIHGAEVDLSDGRHLTLLVQDARVVVRVWEIRRYLSIKRTGIMGQLAQRAANIVDLILQELAGQLFDAPRQHPMQQDAGDRQDCGNQKCI